MRAILLVLGVLAATPAMAADQFDLVCTAKKTVIRYRLDLTRGEWCFDQCKLVQKIDAITSGTITLRLKQPANPRDSSVENRINRNDGGWYWYSYFPQMDLAPSVTEGHCEVASFSGFPAAKF